VPGSLEEDLAEAEVLFGQREVRQRYDPHLLAQQRGTLFDGGGYQSDQVPIAPAVEVAEEAVAPVVLPADEALPPYGVFSKRMRR
jgi:hypothetical protein